MNTHTGNYYVQGEKYVPLRAETKSFTIIYSTEDSVENKVTYTRLEGNPY